LYRNWAQQWDIKWNTPNWAEEIFWWMKDGSI
jgi:hypothetical protein